MTLRDYQETAVRMVDDYYSQPQSQSGRLCLVLPTGAGKSVIAAALVSRTEGRSILLTHQKELLEQDAGALARLMPDFDITYYSAMMGHKDLDGRLVCASVQSLYRLKGGLPHFDLVIIDEAHLINNKRQGMYREVLARLEEANPPMRTVGLTATPYRLGQGLLTDDGFFDKLAEPVTIPQLQDAGYLAHLTCKSTDAGYDFSSLRIRGGEFRQDDMDKAVSRFGTSEAVVDEIVARGADRKAWLVFCVSVRHAKAVLELLDKRGISAFMVDGGTPKNEREAYLSDFRAGEYRCAVNVSILTTGFDYPDIDLIAMLRPTMSPGLYLQMVGRGMRVKSDPERNCLVLDFAGNVMRHGPVDEVRAPVKPTGRRQGASAPPAKVCPTCGEIVGVTAQVCKVCGHIFPIEEKKWSLDDSAAIESRDRKNQGPRVSRIGAWRWDICGGKGGAMLRCRYMRRSNEDRTIVEFFPIWHQGYAGTLALKRYFALCGELGYEGSDTAEGLVHDLNMYQAPKAVIYRINDKGYADVVARSWKEERA